MTSSTKDENTLMALFGGTFDPVHFGHLRPVEQLAHEIDLEKVILLPNNVPPHRPNPRRQRPSG